MFQCQLHVFLGFLFKFWNQHYYFQELLLPFFWGHWVLSVQKVWCTPIDFLSNYYFALAIDVVLFPVFRSKNVLLESWSKIAGQFECHFIRPNRWILFLHAKWWWYKANIHFTIFFRPTIQSRKLDTRIDLKNKTLIFIFNSRSQ